MHDGLVKTEVKEDGRAADDAGDISYTRLKHHDYGAAVFTRCPARCFPLDGFLLDELFDIRYGFENEKKERNVSVDDVLSAAFFVDENPRHEPLTHSDSPVLELSSIECKGHWKLIHKVLLSCRIQICVGMFTRMKSVDRSQASESRALPTKIALHARNSFAQGLVGGIAVWNRQTLVEQYWRPLEMKRKVDPCGNLSGDWLSIRVQRLTQRPPSCWSMAILRCFITSQSVYSGYQETVHEWGLSPRPRFTLGILLQKCGIERTEQTYYSERGITFPFEIILALMRVSVPSSPYSQEIRVETY
ncbi:hypothetical protein EDD85DRAFT_931022 [Armillaria nabsnona]|nr:hypothetical protein EDD85DRAFT_931022 [Armillaria nabsnona]